MGRKPETELEHILEIVEEPLKRAKLALHLLADCSDKDETAINRYAELYLNALMEGDESSKEEFSTDEDSEDPGAAVLRLLPDNKAAEMAAEYVQVRLKHFMLQDRSLPADLEEIKKIIDDYGIVDHSYEILSYAENIIHPPIFGRKSIPEDLLDKVMETVASMVRNSAANNNLESTCQVFMEDRFRSRYSDDETIRKLAERVLEIELEVENKNEFWGAHELISHYNIECVDDVVGRAAVNHITKGNIAQAQKIAEEFGLEISDDHLQKAKDDILNKLTDAAFNCDIDTAIEQNRILKAIRKYAEKGPDKDSIPRAVVPEGYKGKIAVINYRGESFLRTCPGNPAAGYHPTIVELFKRELQEKGLPSDIETTDQSGAYLEFTHAGTIRIYGTSSSLGECDKRVARELVEHVFPEREIVIEPARE